MASMSTGRIGSGGIYLVPVRFHTEDAFSDSLDLWNHFDMPCASLLASVAHVFGHEIWEEVGAPRRDDGARLVGRGVPDNKATAAIRDVNRSLDINYIDLSHLYDMMHLFRFDCVKCKSTHSFAYIF